jgi:hypothetical protein
MPVCLIKPLPDIGWRFSRLRNTLVESGRKEQKRDQL